MRVFSILRTLGFVLSLPALSTSAAAQQPFDSHAGHAASDTRAQDRPAAQGRFEPKSGQAGKDVVWVPSPPEMVNMMMEMAKVAAVSVHGTSTDEV